MLCNWVPIPNKSGWALIRLRGYLKFPLRKVEKKEPPTLVEGSTPKMSIELK